MFYIFTSLVVAMTVGLGAHLAYGTEALYAHPWVDHVVASIIGSGVALAALSWARCALCRVSKAGADEIAFCGARTCHEH